MDDVMGGYKHELWRIAREISDIKKKMIETHPGSKELIGAIQLLAVSARIVGGWCYMASKNKGEKPWEVAIRHEDMSHDNWQED